MTLPQAVNVDAESATVTATSPVKHLCPFKKETDEGNVTITWVCHTSTIELHSLAAYLDGFAEAYVSHETLVADIFEELSELDGITICSVTARFTTAGIDVEVRRGPVHVDAVGA